jgi:3-oxoacyl-[acyl-carrier protein] reductase
VEEFLSLIKNSNIIITGTSSGIGKELAIKFLKQGNTVWGCARNRSTINKNNYFHKKLDLSDTKQIKKWIDEVEKESNKKVDVLISNAAVFTRKLNPLDSFDAISETIKVNLIAPMLMTNMISKFMIQNKKGLIVLFSSAAAIISDLKLPISLTIGTSSYASSKAGLETFGQILRKELEKFNIKVATIRVLHTPTKLSDKLSIKEVKILKSKFKSDKFGNPEKIFKEINKLYDLKKISKNNLFSDELKND